MVLDIGTDILKIQQIRDTLQGGSDSFDNMGFTIKER